VAVRRLAEAGGLERVGRGLYALPNQGRATSGLVIAARRVPNGVVCLLSALQMHGLTTQLPREVWMAIGTRDRRPKTDGVRLRIVRYSSVSLGAGVDTRRVDGVAVRVFSPAKTIADCFKYRNKIGLDVATEALRDGLRRRTCTVDELWRYAKVNRVATVMRPYLEALT
jgi:predicted transcriptional regulator of viral defense system